jgi:predicted SAM-dependent methyltransferase
MADDLSCIELIKRIGVKFGSLLAPLRPIVRCTRTFFRTRFGARRLRRAFAASHAPRIVVGSSGIFEPGWIPTEIEVLNLLRPADWKKFVSENSLAAILSEHVWEHLTTEEGAVAANTCLTYLRPGGYLRLAVPDGFNPDPDYREWVRPGGSGPGANDHKTLYTHESLGRLLSNAGFQVELLEYFDVAGQFHFTDWDPADGMIHRSRRFDERNHDGQLRYTSLIIDAVKPSTSNP